MDKPVGIVSSEFATVEVSVDECGNGSRLRLDDRRTGQVGYLDALELETLAWLPEGALHRLLDPSHHRWREDRQDSLPALVRRLYAALAAGDALALEELLAPGFDGLLAEGLPLGIGGRHRGVEDMREHGWWAIGRAFKLRVEPSEWIACGDGRLLVLGRYVGSARSTGAPVEARFVHVWAARDGRLSALWHLTDTAPWVAALAAVGGGR